MTKTKLEKLVLLLTQDIEVSKVEEYVNYVNNTKNVYLPNITNSVKVSQLLNKEVK